MKSKSITAYTIIIAAVFGLAIFFFAFSTIREYKTGFMRTGSMFDHLVSGTRNTALAYDSNSNEFHSTFEQLTGSKDNYNSLVLSKNNLPIYTYPSGTGEQSVSSKFQKQYTESFHVNGDNYKITASMYLLRPSSMFYFSRFSFFIVLMATVLTLILILYLHLSQNKVTAEPMHTDEPKSDEEKIQDERFSVDQIYFNSDFLKNNDTKEPTSDASIVAETKDTEDIDNKEEEKLEQPETVKEAEKDISNKLKSSDPKKIIRPLKSEELIKAVELKRKETKLQPKTADTEKSLQQKIVTDENKVLDNDEQLKTQTLFNKEKIKSPIEETAPQGLFSPITGFGWEQYLETRLDSELIRATSSELDLSLFMIRIPGLLFTDPLSKIVCMYLQQQFQYNDLLFEYKQDGFSIIRENISVDDSLALAETLHAEIMKIISEKGYNCYIGLSTRSVRILPGSRLILEATEALRHAVESKESPIFAFKANDEKYREYIDSKA